MVKSIFFEPRNKYLAEIIRIDAPKNAAQSVRRLFQEFYGAATHEKRMKIWRAATLATERAHIIAENPRVSRPQQDEARDVARIYGETAASMARMIG